MEESFQVSRMTSTLVTHEGSMSEYRRILENPKPGPEVPAKPLRGNLFSENGKAVVAIVRSDDRRAGIREALRLIGDLGPLVHGVKGEIVIKPNCNTDDPFPRNSHPETVRVLIESLIEEGFQAGHIVVGDMSGRYRGLPTRNTMANMGLNQVAEELGIRLSYFEEEDWVTVRPPASRAWPNGIKIPRRIYEAERVILTPVVRTHDDATFTISMKLAVGLIDAAGREWLHDGKEFFEKMLELNLAFSTDLVVTDALASFVDHPPRHRQFVKPGILIAGGNRVAADAAGVAIMKHYGAYGIAGNPVLGQKQLILADELGLGKRYAEDMMLKTSNLEGDKSFEDLVLEIETELTEQ
jgi:uncharacterized protein (DUF362 family)